MKPQAKPQTSQPARPYPFDPGFSELPKTLPIFPLSGGMLLPGGHLPLNIFERKYLEMVRAAMREKWLIGMVQPLDDSSSGPDTSDDAADETPSLLYKTGCAGKICSLSETEDGRYLITLRGLIRFKIEEELVEKNGFRRIRPNWKPFRNDLDKMDSLSIDRSRLLDVMQEYFYLTELHVDWQKIVDMPETQLITLVAMVCPFTNEEKQALLEVATTEERAETLIAYMEMTMNNLNGNGIKH